MRTTRTTAITRLTMALLPPLPLVLLQATRTTRRTNTSAPALCRRVWPPPLLPLPAAVSERTTRRVGRSRSSALWCCENSAAICFCSALSVECQLQSKSKSKIDFQRIVSDPPSLLHLHPSHIPLPLPCPLPLSAAFAFAHPCPNAIHTVSVPLPPRWRDAFAYHAAAAHYYVSDVSGLCLSHALTPPTHIPPIPHLRVPLLLLLRCLMPLSDV